MGFPTGKLLARTLRDVTGVKGEDLRAERFFPRLVSNEPPQIEATPAACQVVCIASGKGGTGKSVVTTNLAVALAQGGWRVLIFDADMGLANVHMLMGVTPAHDVAAVLDGRVPLAQAVVECPGGVRLVPGGSGFSELAELPAGKLRCLADQIAACEGMADLLLVDAAAGIGPQVMRFLQAAHEILLVTTPDATALLDAYAVIKSLARLQGTAAVRLIVNRARDRAEAIESFKKVQAVAARHVSDAEIAFFGWIPQHWYVQESVRQRHPVVLSHPKSFVTAAFRSIAAQMASMHREWKGRQQGLASSGITSGPRASFSSRLARTPAVTEKMVTEQIVRNPCR